MDRSRSSAAQHSTAVRTARCAAFDLLLPAAAGKLGEPAPDAPARSVVHEAPVFRQPENGRRTGDQSQTRATADADSGHRSALSQTQLEPSGTGSRNLSVLAARRRHRKTKSRLEYRYCLGPYRGHRGHDERLSGSAEKLTWPWWFRYGVMKEA